MPTRRLLLGAAAAALAGCAPASRPTVVPMATLRLDGSCPGRAETLVLLLPGLRSLPQEFVDEGFVAALRQRGIAADVVAADAHFGYYADRSVLDRLRADVVLPARAAGYRAVWIVGISLGGLGALAYPLRHPGEVDGVVALAPYVGERELLREIAAVGGARAWAASAPPAGPDALDRELWQRWALTPPPLPLYLGWGDSDRFADSERAFAALLPPERVLHVPGGHDWRAWQRLWEALLDRGLFAAGCRA